MWAWVRYALLPTKTSRLYIHLSDRSEDFFSTSSQVASMSQVKEGSCLILVAVIMSPVYCLEPKCLDFSWGKTLTELKDLLQNILPVTSTNWGIRLRFCVTVVPSFYWLTCLFGVCLAKFWQCLVVVVDRELEMKKSSMHWFPSGWAVLVLSQLPSQVLVCAMMCYVGIIVRPLICMWHQALTWVFSVWCSAGKLLWSVFNI